MELNEAEFARIIRENKGTIYTVCYMFSKDKEEVDDLFQEALIKLWQGLASFKGDSDLKTWIYKVTLNSCISIDRKKKSRKTQPLMEGIDLFDKNDADNKQTDMLHARIQRLQPHRAAVAREHELSGDSPGCRYRCQKRVGSPLPHQGTT